MGRILLHARCIPVGCAIKMCTIWNTDGFSQLAPLSSRAFPNLFFTTLPRVACSFLAFRHLTYSWLLLGHKSSKTSSNVWVFVVPFKVLNFKKSNHSCKSLWSYEYSALVVSSFPISTPRGQKSVCPAICWVMSKDRNYFFSMSIFTHLLKLIWYVRQIHGSRCVPNLWVPE